MESKKVILFSAVFLFLVACSRYTESDHYKVRKVMAKNQKIMFEFWLNTPIDNFEKQQKLFDEVLANFRSMDRMNLNPYSNNRKNFIVKEETGQAIKDLEKLPRWSYRTVYENFETLKRTCSTCHIYFLDFASVKK
ncbi:MAG: hypothetical protein HY606_07850 [Planctomycetes bacterium]|nr:hypothetical protein [Planctomycetota bacterium]